MKLQATLPKSVSSKTLFVLLFTTFLNLIELAICNKKVYIFLKLIPKNSIVPEIEIG